MRDSMVRVSLILVVGFTVSAGLAGAATVGLSDVDFEANNAAILTGAGHTVVLNPDLTLPITVDVLYLGRGQAGISGASLTNVQNFLAAGGTVMTELGSTELWFDGALASFSGTVVDTFFVPSGDVGGGNLVTVTDPSAGITNLLPPSWISGDPIGVFRVYSGLDPAIATPIFVLGTNQGDLPVVGTAAVGAGCAIMFFTDFADFNSPIMPEEEQLLINAVEAGCGEAQNVPIPTMSGSGVLVLVLLIAGAGAAILARLRWS